MARTPKQRPSRYRKRVILMQALAVLTLGAIALRIQYVQSWLGPTLLGQADKVQNTSQELIAQRGALLDRNGNRLAYDVPAYMMDIKTSSFSDLAALADKLAPILKKPSADLEKLLKSGKQGWVRWPDPVLDTDKSAILKAVGKDHSSDVTFTPTEKRIYPYGSFAANTLGYVTQDGKSAAGLEAEYNDVLAGRNGEISYTRDIWGFPLQTTMKTDKPAVPGKDVELTIDQTIQSFVEQEMDGLVKKYKPAHAAIIVEDPNTGEILAMASRPTFDPNQYWKGSSTALSSNWAVNESFEPGSTFKALTLIAGLATNTISLDNTFKSGHMSILGQTIYDWNRVGWGTITFREALFKSSNVGFATVALKLGWNKLMDYMNTFGFLKKTGVDLPAEGNSQMFAPQDRGRVQLATSGFGQGIAVTPMQLIQAYAAIANRGKLIQPHLAKATIDPNSGKVIKEFKPVVKNSQVAPPSVLKQVSDTLIGDVNNPEGIDAVGKLDGYDVAGKTGTANIASPSGKYYTDRFNVSFIGYAPGNAPKVEVLVTLNWPKTPIDSTWGSTIATPAARDILKQCMEYYHIPPTSGKASKQTSSKPSIPSSTHYVQTPDLVGKKVSTAKATLKKLKLSGDILGTGSTVKNQWPEAGVEVPTGSHMYAWAPGAGSSSVTMPDLTGASIREAGNILAAAGLKLQASGYGFAAAQSVAAGKSVKAGETIKVTFAPPDDPVQQALTAENNKSSTDNNKP